MPSAARSFAVIPASAIAFSTADIVQSQISRGSCSTQPSSGKYCANSSLTLERTAPFASKTIEVVPVVPWSIAVSYTHLRAHETRHDLVCRLLLEKKKKNTT